MNINIFWDIEPHKLPSKMFGPQNIVRRDDAILEDLLFMIDVVKEEV